MTPDKPLPFKAWHTKYKQWLDDVYVSTEGKLFRFEKVEKGYSWYQVKEGEVEIIYESTNDIYFPHLHCQEENK